MINVRYMCLGAVIALMVTGAAVLASYAVLNHFYGEGYVITSTRTLIIENSGRQITIENTEYSVESVEYVANENVYRLGISPPPRACAENGSIHRTSMDAYTVDVESRSYDLAQRTGNPVTIADTTATKTKPINTLPIASSVGIGMGVVVFAVWMGNRRSWGDATSTLLEHGLHDMTVRDAQIVGYIMQRDEFTIPELMKLTKTSKITVWRTVQKLVERGLVQPTQKTRLAANGLGGRGKPSRVYRYIGIKGSSKEETGSISKH